MAKLYLPGYQFLDSNGAPVESGTVSFYTNGTTTLKNIYTDPELATAATNPAPLDSAGRFNQGDLYGSGIYTVVLKTSAAAQLWTRDDYNPADATALGAATATSISFGNEVLDVYDEATWTPVLTFATPGNLNVVYSVQAGQKTIIGRLVDYQFNVTTSTFTHTTASGNCQITGLGSTNLNVAGNTRVGTLHFQGITKATYTQFSCFYDINTATAIFLAGGSAVGQATVGTADMPTTGSIILIADGKIITA